MFSPSLSRLNNLPRANDISMPGWAQCSEESEKKPVQVVVLVTMPHYSRWRVGRFDRGSEPLVSMLGRLR